MHLTRIGSTSVPASTGRGSCAACHEPLRSPHDGVRLYGELFHRDCAFAPRRRRKGARR